jgi:hypothetical protein
MEQFHELLQKLHMGLLQLEQGRLHEHEFEYQIHIPNRIIRKDPEQKKTDLSTLDGEGRNNQLYIFLYQAGEGRLGKSSLSCSRGRVEEDVLLHFQQRNIQTTSSIDPRDNQQDNRPSYKDQ